MNEIDTKQAESEIALIRKIMEDSKRIAVSDGKDFIFWGILVLAGVVVMYYMLIKQVYGYIGLLWGIDILLGWMTSLTMHFREEKKKKVRTFAGKVLGALWISCGIAMTLIGFIAGMTGQVSGWAIFPMIGIILGIAYFVSGIIYGYSWVNYLSIGWWGGSVFMLIYPGIHSLLVFALMMTLFQIVPGIILYLKWKKELSPASA